ncbi:UNVERIFIED_CONTAM: hypothetical protein HDU68_009405 [Siphonaria sp. JEL0065]|nr:hypothetical protein HDU68_009405 [Siphonaria sp. JEL0065]
MFIYAVLLASTVFAKTVSYDWTITNFTQALDGVERFALGINGKPGHETFIQATKGDKVVVFVTNNLLVPTSIHFHGLFQNGTIYMDGPVGITQCPIAPGQTYVYEFYTAEQTGTYWWHAHDRLHYMDGLRGPMVIQDPAEQSYDLDQVIQLADWYHDQTEAMLAWYLSNVTNPGGNEPVWNSGLVNGIGQFDCSATNLKCNTVVQPYTVQNVKAGSISRLRLVNTAGFAAFLVSVDGHSLTVIEVDGIRVDPYEVDALTINVAQRYSVLITANQKPGNYLIRATMYHGSPWTSMPDMPPGFNPNITAILNYAGVNPKQAPITVSAPSIPFILDDRRLRPVEKMAPPQPTSDDFTMLFEFQFKSLDTDDHQKAYVNVSSLTTNKNLALWEPAFSNSFTSSAHPLLSEAHDGGAQWKPSKNSNSVSIKSGQVVDIIIRNNDGGEHPFHLHGHVFWVLATGVAKSIADIPRVYTETNPLRRDVVTVPACPVDEEGECVGADKDVEGGSKPDHAPLPASQVEDSWFGYTVIRFVADNPGVWLFHCHIEWHIAAGLVMTFVESLRDIQKMDKPQIADDTCKAYNDWLTVNPNTYPANDTNGTAYSPGKITGDAHVYGSSSNHVSFFSPIFLVFFLVITS